MSSFVALAVPARRRDALASLAMAASRMLGAGWPDREVLRAEEHGKTASVAFLRVDGDPFSAGGATCDAGTLRVVQAGYFLGGDVASVDRSDWQVAGTGSLASVLTREGPAGLRKGDGVFAFASWDTSTERFVAGVDKLGMRPLFWCEVRGGGVAVASEIKALLPLVGELEVNWAAWEDQVRHGFQIGNHTLVRGVFRFERAGCLTWSDGRLEHTVLEHFLESVPIRRFNEASFIEENNAAFSASMSRLVHLLDDCPTLLTISGGLDSRRLLAGLLCAGRAPELLTVANPRPDGREEECAITERVAKAAGLPLKVVRPVNPSATEWGAQARDAYADFETDEHGVYALVAAAVGVRSAVNFDGLAGDTLLNPAQFVRRDYLRAGGEERFLAAMSDGGQWVKFPTGDDSFAVRLQRQWNAIRESPNPLTCFALDTRGRRELSLGPMLIQARAFESVYPFLDREFMLSALSLPPEVRLRGQLQRTLAERMWPNVAGIPSTRDPNFEAIPGVVRQVPGWRTSRPRSVLRSALRTGSSATRLPAGEQAKLLLAAILGDRIGAESYSWQWGKANWVRRIRLQEELISEGPERYAEFIDDALTLPAAGVVRLETRAP